MVDLMLLEGLDDFVDASWVFGLTIDAGAVTDDDRRCMTVGAIAEVLARGFMEPGGFADMEYRVWDCTTAEAIARIAIHWATVGNVSPLSNEIVWLRNTPAGDEYVRSLELAYAPDAHGEPGSNSGQPTVKSEP
ncbi:hypothetical protein [uncultured Microbacterium sp.]|uniref:hypothetical protein n=1 Tax=uncultured Microbacterium sp. TaxID=191216 RepID=UPI0025E37F61|nr:hypothetical protein [uncultured Microbacterium sp.]